MGNAKIRCWIKTHKRMKWRLALESHLYRVRDGIVKAAEWNPELSSKYKTYRAMGGPRRRWEDDINDSSSSKRLRPKTLLKVTTNTTIHGSKQKKTVERWTLPENDYTKTAEERSENNARHRSNPSKPTSKIRCRSETE